LIHVPWGEKSFRGNGAGPRGTLRAKKFVWGVKTCFQANKGQKERAGFLAVASWGGRGIKMGRVWVSDGSWGDPLGHAHKWEGAKARGQMLTMTKREG